MTHSFPTQRSSELRSLSATRPHARTWKGPRYRRHVSPSKPSHHRRGKRSPRADAYAGVPQRRSRPGVACHQSVIAAFCSIKGIEILIAAVDSRGFARRGVDARADEGGKAAIFRSEEHTSELQSLMRISYAVFCLKKKNTSQIRQH